MNDANNAGTHAPCKFCGTYPNPNDPSCATLEQSYARTEVRPFGCPYFTDSDRKMYPLSTPNAPVEQVDESAEFEKAWAKRPWTTTRTDKERAFYWWSARAILAVRLDEAVIRKDEREKCDSYRNALLWAFDRLSVTGGLDVDTQRRTMREIGNVLTGRTSPAATYQPNDDDDSVKLTSAIRSGGKQS